MFANFCIAEATMCQFPHEYFKGRNSGILDLIPTSWVNRRKRFMQKLVLSKKANLKPCEVAESGRRLARSNFLAKRPQSGGHRL